MSRPRVCLLGILFLAAGTCRAFAGDVYAVRFEAHSHLADGFLCVNWYDDLVFHNPTSTDATVSLLGLSNSPTPTAPTALVVPAGKTVAATTHVNWNPIPPTPLWIVHLDVPDGLIVQSRAEAFSEICIGGVPPSLVPDYGAFSLPIGRSLTPAGSKKVFLGADLGAEANHSNVGVFNGGTETAHAVIEIHEACGEVLLDSRTISIAPDMLVQVNGLAAGLGAADNGCPTYTPGNWVRYVTVTVDQPSFSYVVVKMDDLTVPPTIPYGAPLPQ